MLAAKRLLCPLSLFPSTSWLRYKRNKVETTTNNSGEDDGLSSPVCEPSICRACGFQFSSVTQSCLTLQPHESQHARPPCPSPAPGVYPNSCPLSQWCHPTISSSVIPFSSYLQSFPASGSIILSQLFKSGGQSTGNPTSVLPKNIQDWFPFGLTGLISLQSKGLPRVFSNTTVQKYQFFGAQLSS